MNGTKVNQPSSLSKYKFWHFPKFYFFVSTYLSRVLDFYFPKKKQ